MKGALMPRRTPLCNFTTTAAATAILKLTKPSSRTSAPQTTTTALAVIIVNLPRIPHNRQGSRIHKRKHQQHSHYHKRQLKPRRVSLVP